jgi:DNA processing protein
MTTSRLAAPRPPARPVADEPARWEARELAAAASLAETDGPRPQRPASAAFGQDFDAAAFVTRLRAAGYRVLPRSSAAYPTRLAAIHDPPAALFVRGAATVDLLERPAIAVVGARACSAYGSTAARSLARELARAGAVVVSGLARGIDGSAHRGALEAGGPTVAVLGCGIDRIYPAAHRRLAEEICASGLVVSEYPPGVAPAPWRFPARNRIIAGLTVATVVVEARARSGALITADFALEEGRDVLAVPGEITSALSAGTNALIRSGAPLVCEAADVLAAVGLAGPGGAEPAPAAAALASVGPEAEAVLAALADSPAGADHLTRATGLSANVVAAALAQLELEGVVAEGAGVYRVVMPQAT